MSVVKKTYKHQPNANTFTLLVCTGDTGIAVEAIIF